MRSFYLITLISAFIGIEAYANTTTASFYADKFNGRKTANGETFSNQNMTCASNQYKLGTYVEVTNVKTGKSITCKINDRIGKAGRIDLTQNAFKQLAPLSAGLVKVRVSPIDAASTNTKKNGNANPESLAKEQLTKEDNKASQSHEQDGGINLALEPK